MTTGCPAGWARPTWWSRCRARVPPRRRCRRPGRPPAALAEQARAGFIGVEPLGMPRSMLWGLSVPLVVSAARLGILDVPEQAYEAAAAELERVAHLCRPDSESFV